MEFKPLVFPFGALHSEESRTLEASSDRLDWGPASARRQQRTFSEPEDETSGRSPLISLPSQQGSKEPYLDLTPQPLS